MKAERNDADITINPKIPRNHTGFVDAHGKPLEPGDEIIVKTYDRLCHAVITRFTPRRVYWRLLTVTSDMVPYWKEYECATQLHQYYSKGGTRGAYDSATGISTPVEVDPQPHTMMRNIIKLEAL